jgi:hypothetical protein
MKRDATNNIYITNKSVRAKIDSYLEKANSLFANLGTKSSRDVGSMDMARAMDFQYMQKIKEIDSIFYYEFLHGKYMDDEISEFLEKVNSKTLSEYIEG